MNGDNDVVTMFRNLQIGEGTSLSKQAARTDEFCWDAGEENYTEGAMLAPDLEGRIQVHQEENLR